MIDQAMHRQWGIIPCHSKHWGVSFGMLGLMTTLRNITQTNQCPCMGIYAISIPEESIDLRYRYLGYLDNCGGADAQLHRVLVCGRFRAGSGVFDAGDLFFVGRPLPAGKRVLPWG